MKKTLSKLLIDRGMTVTELAEKTGISYNTLMNIGKRDLSFSRMVKIADALDVSLDEFRKGWEYAMDTWSVEGSRWVNSKRISRGIRRFFTDDCKTRER